MDQTHTSMIFDRGAIKPDQVGEYGKATTVPCSGWAASRS